MSKLSDSSSVFLSRSSYRRFVFILIAALAGSSVGCAAAAKKQWEQQFQEGLEAGATADSYISEHGPAIVTDIGNGRRVLTWRFSYGQRFLWPLPVYQEQYDKIVLTFDEAGKLEKYKVECQR